jgi:hypothetical protein
MADAEAAERSAEDNGAANNPQGQLHLKLAEEGIARAKGLLASGDNERADYVLIRAKSDAELALGESREEHTREEAQKAMDRVAKMQSSLNQAGTITTTSAATTVSPSVTTSTTTTSTSQGVKR